MIQTRRVKGEGLFVKGVKGPEDGGYKSPLRGPKRTGVPTTIIIHNDFGYGVIVLSVCCRFAVASLLGHYPFLLSRHPSVAPPK